MKLFWVIFLACAPLLHISVVAENFVVLGFEEDLDVSNPRFRARRNAGKSEPNITSYHITSRVTARYVSTSIVADITNDDDELSKEVVFAVLLNKNAFISGLEMTVDGVPYVTTVREKVVAYNQTRRRGQGAAQDKDETVNCFLVDLNLAARASAVLKLTYQELLRRDKGQFKHTIIVAPGQVVEYLRIEVYITEPQGLESLEASWSPLDKSIQPFVSFSPYSVEAYVLLTPSKVLQSQISRTKGLCGDFEITYDVVHPLDGGDLQVVNGYFVHHISPEGIPPASKKVIFVIDVSGSMSGDKMEQTKEAMLAILYQLRDIDSFNVLTFQSSVSYWKSGVVPAAPQNIELAQDFVRSLIANGSTNIHESLLASAQQFQTTDDAFPAVIFLTDGLPSAGVTLVDDILSSVEQAFNKRIALFTIGFGNDVDDILLGKLSAENQGIYRKVYHDSSASRQMLGFFDEVATPLLFNIDVQYLDNAVDTTTITSDHHISYFDGGELLVAGKIADDFEGNSLNAVVTAVGRDRQIELLTSNEIDQALDPNMVEDFAQRTWAFLTIKNLLANEKLAITPEEKAELKQRALELSLKYSFVTPLTSMLVIKTSLNQTSTSLGADPHFVIDILEANRTICFDIQAENGTYMNLISKFVLAEAAKRPAEAAKRPPSTDIYDVYTVGADPHFVIDIPHTNLTICFDIQAENGTFMNLVSDPILDVYVNAEIIPRDFTPSPPDPSDSNRLHSLISTLGIQLGHYKILVTPKHVLVDFEISMEWDRPRSVIIGQFNITIHNKCNLTIVIGDVITMRVGVHNKWRNHPDHLDFTVETANGFSDEVHGLLGQFQYKAIFLKDSNIGTSRNGHIKGLLDVEGKKKAIYKTVEVIAHKKYDCWWSVPATFIDGEVKQYFVPGYFSHLMEQFL